MTINITQLPAAPSRNDDPSTFAAKADAMLAALTTFINQLNAYAPEVYAASVNGGFDVTNGQLNVTDSSTSYSMFVEQSGEGGVFRSNNAYVGSFAANQTSNLHYTTRLVPANTAFLLRNLDTQLLLDQNGKNLTAGLSSGGAATNRNYVAVTGSSGTVDAASGLVSDVRNTGGGVLTEAAGFISYFDNAGAGSIGSSYGFYATNATPGTSGNYGFYSAINSGTANWAFYGAGTAPSYLGGALTVVGDVTSSGNMTVSGQTSRFGYAIGAGGTISQATSRTTEVVLNKPCGTITLFSTTATAGQVVEFTFTNSRLTANDVILFTQKSGAGMYIVQARTVSAGSCIVKVYTPVAVGTAEAPSFNFAILRSVVS